MLRFPLTAGVVCLFGCAAGPEGGAPDKKLAKDVRTVFAFFRSALEGEHYAAAYDVLSRDTKKRITYEEFYLAFSSESGVMRRVLKGLFAFSEPEGPPRETEGGAERAAPHRQTVCNRLYGFHEEFLLIPEFGGKFWTIRIPEEQQDRLLGYARRCWDFQHEAAGDFYVYARGQSPPWRCAGGGP